MFTILAWLAIASPAPATLPPLNAVICSVETYDELIAEFDSALAQWKEKYTSEDAGGKKRMRKIRPAAAFATRFETLASAGDGRALVWQLENLRHIGLKGKARNVKRERCYEQLFTKHVTVSWFGDVLTQAWKDRRRFADEKFSAYLDATRQGNKHAEVRAQSGYYLAVIDAGSEDETTRELGFAALEALIAELPDTTWAEQAKQDLFLLRDRAVGAMAIDFDGKTVDGEEFKLSDYRGKVVLLDFYGFW